MKRRVAAIFLSAFFFVSCQSSVFRGGGGIIDPALLKAYRAIDESMNQKRSALMFEGGGSVVDCEAYLTVSVEKEIVESVSNQAVKSEYLVCDALRLLSQAKRFTGGFDASRMGVDLRNALDVRTFPNSLVRMADERSYTLAQLFPEQSYATGVAVVYDADDWFLGLKVVAVADINRNSILDWIVQLTDESTEGNYRNYATLVIYDPKAGEVLKAALYR